MKHSKTILLPLLPILFACQTNDGPVFERGLLRSGLDVEVSSYDQEMNYGDLSSLGYIGTYTESTETDSLTIEINQGYFLNPNLEIGGGFIFSNDDTQVTARDAGTIIGTGGVKDKLFGFSGYARYYFVPEGSTRFFGEAQLGLANGSRDVTGGSSIDLDGFLFGISGGAVTFITESSAIEVELAYSSTKLNGTDSAGMTFDIDGTDIALLLGYTFFF